MINLFRQFSSFVVVGFIATGVQFALLIGLVELAGIPAVAAALIGYGSGGLVSYSLNRRHVFRSNAPHQATVARFTLVAAVGFGLTYLLCRCWSMGPEFHTFWHRLRQPGSSCFGASPRTKCGPFRHTEMRNKAFAHLSGAQGHRARGGSDDKIASTLPPVFRPKIVPRS